MLPLLLSVLILPADTVTGRVVDNAGHPVPQAIVEITQLGTSVTAGADGAFVVALAPGRYTLAVRRHGFAPAVREISVGAGQAALEIVLTPSAFNLEPVTVTAARQPLASASSPLPATALAGDELRQAQRVSLAHVVEVLPGVRAITTGSQIGKPVIRGFSGPRVLVLENGSRLEDYSWSDEDGPSVETAFVRRVELIRGPASVLYGSDALGGEQQHRDRPGCTSRRRAQQPGLARRRDRPACQQFAHARGRAGQYRLRRVQRRSDSRLALAVGECSGGSCGPLRRRVEAARGERTARGDRW